MSFLRYMSGMKGYKLWCPKTRKVMISRYIALDELAIVHGSPRGNSDKIEKQKIIQLKWSLKLVQVNNQRF